MARRITMNVTGRLSCSPSGLHGRPGRAAPQFRNVTLRGYSLIELVAAMGITAVLLAAIASTVVIATKALPKSGDAFSSAVAAGRAVDQMAGELESALLVLEQTPTSIAFTVPPRNGDTVPEKIRYSWASKSGAPLLRQYNAGQAVAVIDAVDQLSLTPVIATSTESYPGVATEDTADSLLIDYGGTSGSGSQGVDASNWVGQYFASNTWPVGVVGWRPTRVQFQGKQSGLIATTNVQFQPALANFTPASTVLEQYTVTGSGLLASFSWQQFSFSTIDRLSPAAGICFVLQWVGGTPSSVIAQTNAGAGLTQTLNGGGLWNYVGNRAIQSQLFGKLSRSSTTQYSTSRFLSALAITLRAGPTTNPAVTTTAQLLNRPELLSAYWELKFDKDPTKVDSNSDGQPDWTVHGGGAFNLASLVNSIWQSNGTGLDSNPGDNFAHRTVIDARFNATSAGSWAEVSLNAARSGSSCAPVLARITQQSDGYQSLTVWRKLNDSATDTLLTIPCLPNQPTNLHLIIDPAYGSVAIAVNGVQYGSFAYNVYTSGDTSQSVSLSSSGNAQFGYVRIREAAQ